MRFLRLSFSFSRFLIIFAAGISVYMIDLYVLTESFQLPELGAPVTVYSTSDGILTYLSL